MKFDTLDQCRDEATRFLRKNKKLQREIETWRRENPRYQHIPIDFAKGTAEVRRSSMDLTRALADLRQGK
jgi:hypothetical protein